jgi:hypothetical protein
MRSRICSATRRRRRSRDPRDIAHGKGAARRLFRFDRTTAFWCGQRARSMMRFPRSALLQGSSIAYTRMRHVKRVRRARSRIMMMICLWRTGHHHHSSAHVRCGACRCGIGRSGADFAAEPLSAPRAYARVRAAERERRLAARSHGIGASRKPASAGRCRSCPYDDARREQRAFLPGLRSI